MIPRFDVALFADTGWEPKAVYATLADRYAKGARRSGLIKISRVLAHKGIIATALHGNNPQRGPRPDTLSTVAPSWLDWAQRWRALATHEPGTIRGMFSVIIIAGRWAAEKDPEALEPQLWTRDIAAEYVADTLHAVHAQWAGHNRNTTKKGQPLSSVGKVQRIDSLRGFFTDLIDWEWITPKFDPREVLAGPLSGAPRSVRTRASSTRSPGPNSWPPA